MERQMTLDFTGSAVSLCYVLTVKEWERRSDQTAFDFLLRTKLMKPSWKHHTSLSASSDLKHGCQSPILTNTKTVWLKCFDGIAEYACLSGPNHIVILINVPGCLWLISFILCCRGISAADKTISPLEIWGCGGAGV